MTEVEDEREPRVSPGRRESAQVASEHTQERVAEADTGDPGCELLVGQERRRTL